MSTLVCSAFITLRNGKRLYAFEKGLKAFCWETDKPRNAKSPPALESKDEDNANVKKA